MCGELQRSGIHARYWATPDTFCSRDEKVDELRRQKWPGVLQTGAGTGSKGEADQGVREGVRDVRLVSLGRRWSRQGCCMAVSIALLSRLACNTADGVEVS